MLAPAPHSGYLNFLETFEFITELCSKSQVVVMTFGFYRSCAGTQNMCMRQKREQSG